MSDQRSGTCPVCGAAMYGWARRALPESAGELVVDRCEACGVAIDRASAKADPLAEVDGLLERDRDGAVELRVPNRRSFQAGLGGGLWAVLGDPEAGRVHLTPRAAELVLADLGLAVESISFPPAGPNQAWMRQTLVNAFTLRDNFWTDARAGRIKPVGAAEKAAYALDGAVSLLTMLLLAPIALILELIAVLAGRGGQMRIVARKIVAEGEPSPPL